MTDKERADRFKAIAAMVLVNSDGKEDRSGKGLAHDYACALLTLELLLEDEAMVKDAMVGVALGKGYLAMHPESRAVKALVRMLLEEDKAAEEKEEEK